MNPNDLQVTPAIEIPRGTPGTVVAAIYGTPNEKGTSSLTVTIEYPEGQADKEFYEDVLYFHEGDMSTDPEVRRQTLKPGRLGWINRGIQTLKELGKAASAVNQTFTLTPDGAAGLVGAPVVFAAKQDKDDVTKLVTSQLQYRNGHVTK